MEDRSPTPILGQEGWMHHNHSLFELLNSGRGNHVAIGQYHSQGGFEVRQVLIKHIPLLCSFLLCRFVNWRVAL